MKKLLVLYARYGSGHKSIAEYVANYIDENNKDIEVKTLDITDYGNLLGKIGIKLWDFVGIHRTEFLFDICYEIMDHKISTLAHNHVAKKSYDNKELRHIITEYNPDIVISSHFYASNIITLYNKLGLINTKLFTIITDYRTHECWTRNSQTEDGYIVGNELVKNELIGRGVDSKKIYPYGLPLNITKINNLDHRKDIYKRYNLKGNNNVYLFFGGSSVGSMYYYDYFKALVKMNIKAEVVFVCGKNTKLKNKCDKLIKKSNIKNIKVLGYTNDVLNIMKISDLVISKPGGATITECMEMKVPMLLLPGLGGQERYNARFIKRKKYGLVVRGVWRFKRIIRRLENDETLINRMQEKLAKLDNNKAVEKINELVIKTLSK